MYVIIKQRRYLRAFSDAGATSPGAARTIEELGVHQSPLFRRMVRKGVFVAQDGKFYMDRVAADAFRRRQRRTTIIALVVFFLFFIGVTWPVWFD